MIPTVNHSVGKKEAIRRLRVALEGSVTPVRCAHAATAASVSERTSSTPHPGRQPTIAAATRTETDIILGPCMLALYPCSHNRV